MSARASSVRGAAAAGLGLLVACGGGERKDTKRVVVPVDGRMQTATAHLFESPPAFPLSFSTYLPPGLSTELTPPGESAAITFRPAGEKGARRAFVHLYVAPRGRSEQWASAAVRAAAGTFLVPGGDRELRPARLHPWAVEEYVLRSRGTVHDRVGWVALGRRQGRWYLLVVQYPAALAASFAPRAEQVIAEWRWRDGERPRKLADRLPELR